MIDNGLSDPAASADAAAGVSDPRLAAALARASAAVAELVGLDLAALVRLEGPCDDLVAAGAAVEVLRRQLAAFDTGYVAALEAGGVPARHGCPSTATFLKLQLRLTPSEAKRRVAVAHACAPRAEFGVGMLLPARPLLAAALAAGVASVEHAGVVLAALDRLPDTVPADDVATAEALLVEQALSFTPGQVATCGRRVLDHLDPDGTLRDEAWQAKVRDGVLVADRHGTGIMRFALTTEALELAPDRPGATGRARPFRSGRAGPPQPRAAAA